MGRLGLEWSGVGGWFLVEGGPLRAFGGDRYKCGIQAVGRGVRGGFWRRVDLLRAFGG